MKKKKSANQPSSLPASAAENTGDSLPKTRKPSTVKKTTTKTYVVVDFPLAGEIITTPSYTMRVGASAASNVEISVDEKEWQSCRFSVGYWWFDWAGYESGPHQVSARLTDESGKTVKSKPRRFMVLTAS